MLRCSRCLMQFRERETEGQARRRTVCAESGCEMCFSHTVPGSYGPARVYATPNRPIPLHVVRVETEAVE